MYVNVNMALFGVYVLCPVLGGAMQYLGSAKIMLCTADGSGFDPNTLNCQLRRNLSPLLFLTTTTSEV